jgi:mannose-6-phosphate isomerase-like protein (cupin superfamily)
MEFMTEGAEMSVVTTESLWFIANKARIHVECEEFDLVEVEGRRGDMPPLHVHHDHDETFVVIEGCLSLHLPESCVMLGPGQTFFAPRGIPHVYRVESETAKWFGVGNPPGFADFVREASDPAEDDGFPPAGREPDVERIGAAAAAHGIELLGPPGTMP